eukprot:1161591-Pelagomonas_calceolata.AAC.1
MVVEERVARVVWLFDPTTPSCYISKRMWWVLQSTLHTQIPRAAASCWEGYREGQEKATGSHDQVQGKETVIMRPWAAKR